MKRKQFSKLEPDDVIVQYGKKSIVVSVRDHGNPGTVIVEFKEPHNGFRGEMTAFGTDTISYWGKASGLGE